MELFNTIRWNSIRCILLCMIGSETSLIKNSLPSSATASKRTLTSHDSIPVLSSPPIESQPQPSTGVDVTDNVVAISHTAASPQDDVLIRSPPPSYLQLSRCVGGYSTFTSYAPERIVSSHRNGVGPSPHQNGSVTGINLADVIASRNTQTMSSQPQHCQLTLIDDVVTDVSILPNDSTVNGRASAKELVPYQNGTGSTTVIPTPVVNGTVGDVVQSTTKKVIIKFQFWCWVTWIAK